MKMLQPTPNQKKKKSWCKTGLPACPLSNRADRVQIRPLHAPPSPQPRTYIQSGKFAAGHQLTQSGLRKSGICGGFRHGKPLAWMISGRLKNRPWAGLRRTRKRDRAGFATGGLARGPLAFTHFFCRTVLLRVFQALIIIVNRRGVAFPGKDTIYYFSSGPAPSMDITVHFSPLGAALRQFSIALLLAISTVICAAAYP
jgi:hypothetical protein